MNSGKRLVPNDVRGAKFAARSPDTVVLVAARSDDHGHQVECYVRNKDMLWLTDDWHRPAGMVESEWAEHIAGTVGDAIYNWLLANIGFQEELDMTSET